MWYSSGLYYPTLRCCFSREDQALQFGRCCIKKPNAGRYGFNNSTGSDLKPQNCLVLLWVNSQLFPAPLACDSSLWAQLRCGHSLSRHFSLLPPPSPSVSQSKQKHHLAYDTKYTQRHPNIFISAKLFLIFVVLRQERRKRWTSCGGMRSVQYCSQGLLHVSAKEDAVVSSKLNVGLFFHCLSLVISISGMKLVV